MDITLFKKLTAEELISTQELENVERQQHGPVSVFWEVTTLLYVGVLLMAAGLGVLVYKNIDTIGHSIIIIAIGAMCAACFIYCFKKSKGFSYKKVEAPNVLFDYVLLLGCLLMLTFVGYLQFAYKVFGTDYGVATFVPMVILFVAAYYFDHLGVLSMAITNLGAWAGFAVAPLNIIGGNDFSDHRLIFTGLILGSGLVAMAFVSSRTHIKAHFAFSYKNFGLHVLFISLLAAMCAFEALYLLCFLVLAAVSIVSFRSAVKEPSFYFLVVSVLYAYIAVSYVLIELLSLTSWSTGSIYLAFIYFIASGIGLMRFLIHYNKSLKKDAHL